MKTRTVNSISIHILQTLGIVATVEDARTGSAVLMEAPALLVMRVNESTIGDALSKTFPTLSNA